MDVILVNPNLKREEEYPYKIKEIGHAASPMLGIAYLAAVLEENKINVKVIDALALGLSSEGVAKQIENYNPQIVGVTSTTPAIYSSTHLIKEIKSHNPFIKTVLGGAHITALPVRTMEDCPQIDYGVIGEGEFTFLQLCRMILDGKNAGGIQGIVSRTADGKIKMSSSPRPIQPLDQLPFPARHLLPMHIYRPTLVNYRRFPQTSVICSRGCPYQCTFCTKDIFGSKVRMRSPENVSEELKILKTDYRIKEINFYDEIFTLNRRWIMDLCKLIKPLGLIWQCNSRVETINSEMLKIMKEAGCYRISYGVESGNQKSLGILKKGTRIEWIEKAFRLTRSTGIETLAFMMLGIPGENWNDMMRSIDFVLRIKADNAVFTLLTPYPGNEIYQDVKRYGALRIKDWNKYICIPENPVFIPFTTTDKELRRALEIAYRRFVFQPRYVLSRLLDAIHSPSKILPYIKGVISLMR